MKDQPWFVQEDRITPMLSGETEREYRFRLGAIRECNIRDALDRSLTIAQKVEMIERKLDQVLTLLGRSSPPQAKR